ncbi:hypothetical protein QYM36_007737 [Artemia franciscana]|uniref:Uncharacterized protein n=1 Tax=Artemia franciscana TaxID=6661 RepID=A0AA88IUH2_ARTSF|nr:hypothetical protein QYM36_007737 [Artemia franciscana]
MMGSLTLVNSLKRLRLIKKSLNGKIYLGLKLSGDAFQFWTSAPFETLEDFKSAFLLRFATITKYLELNFGKFELKPNQSVVEYASLMKQASEEKFGNNVNPSIVIHDLVNGLPDIYAKLLLEKQPTTYASAVATLSCAEDVQTALRLRKSGGGLEAVNAGGSTNYRGRGNFNRRGNFQHGYEARQLPKSGTRNSFNGQNSGNSSNATTQSRNFYTKDGKPICNKCVLPRLIHLSKDFHDNGFSDIPSLANAIGSVNLVAESEVCCKNIVESVVECDASPSIRLDSDVSVFQSDSSADVEMDVGKGLDISSHSSEGFVVRLVKTEMVLAQSIKRARVRTQLSEGAKFSLSYFSPVDNSKLLEIDDQLVEIDELTTSL